MHQCQMNSQYRLHLHSVPVDGRTGGRSDMDNPQVYIRHKDVRPSSHQKNHLFSKKKKMKKKKFCQKKKKKKKRKKCYPLSFPILGGRDSTRALQSTPFQNPGGVPWAWHTKDEGRRTKDEGRRKSSCLICQYTLGLIFCQGFTFLALTTKTESIFPAR